MQLESRVSELIRQTTEAVNRADYSSAAGTYSILRNFFGRDRNKPKIPKEVADLRLRVYVPLLEQRITSAKIAIEQNDHDKAHHELDCALIYQLKAYGSTINQTFSPEIRDLRKKAYELDPSTKAIMEKLQH